VQIPSSPPGRSTKQPTSHLTHRTSSLHHFPALPAGLHLHLAAAEQASDTYDVTSTPVRNTKGPRRRNDQMAQMTAEMTSSHDRISNDRRHPTGLPRQPSSNSCGNDEFLRDTENEKHLRAPVAPVAPDTSKPGIGKPKACHCAMHTAIESAAITQDIFGSTDDCGS